MACIRFASTFFDCSIYVGHEKRCPRRVKGSCGRHNCLFVQPCEAERKFGKIYKTAWSEHMAYVVDQTRVVADLITHIQFYGDRRGRATYTRRNEVTMYNVEVTIKMFQAKIDIIDFASISGENVWQTKGRVYGLSPTILGHRSGESQEWLYKMVEVKAYNDCMGTRSTATALQLGNSLATSIIL